jgi:hypothetical protein
MRLDPKARAFVRHLYRATDGRPMAWKMLHGMPTTAEAVALAVDRGWCEVAGGRIVCLTDEGRAIVSGVGSDDD